MSNPLLTSLLEDSEPKPWSVSELTARVKSTLEGKFLSVWIEGEISNFIAHSSGHWYFSIKDEKTQVRGTCFRNTNQRIRFRPSNGLLVRVRGRVTVYEPRGEYQLTVESMEPAGAGALSIAFEKMKERLAAEGLFARELKRPVPRFPRRVGVVTSPTGAAIRDILHVLGRRTRTVHILFAAAKVQGEGASAEIIRAIRLLNRHHELAHADGRSGDGIDVLIVGRGGGSAEDLWAFNDEALARAIRASAIPIISAVGHETDFTIADFVADLRAATPSAAAELVAEHEQQLTDRLRDLKRRLWRETRSVMADHQLRVQQAVLSPGFDQFRGRLRSAAQSLDLDQMQLERLMSRRLQRSRQASGELNYRLSPDGLRGRVMDAGARFNTLRGAFEAAGRSEVDRGAQRLAVAGARLDTLSPLAVLGRGYALALTPDGRLVRNAKEVNVGDDLRVRLADGALDCRVTGTET